MLTFLFTLYTHIVGASCSLNIKSKVHYPVAFYKLNMNHVPAHAKWPYFELFTYYCKFYNKKNIVDKSLIH